jgi:hypothetical protein
MIALMRSDLTGIAAGLLSLTAAGAAGVCLMWLRRYRVVLDQAREELHILLRQHQTEYQDGFAQVNQAFSSLEESALNTEAALRGRFTAAQRSQAMQLLRSGIAPETAAATLSLPKRDVQLISRVSRVLAAH